jgi:MFS family permease
VLITVKKMPSLPPIRRGGHFDIAGASILLVTLTAYAGAMTLSARTDSFSPLNLFLFLTAGLGLFGFILVERKKKEPMLDPSLFKNTIFSMNLIMGFAAFVTLAAGFVLPFYLEISKGLPPAQAGLLMTAQPIAMGLVAPLAGALSDKLGARGISTAGLLIGATGCAAVSTLGTTSSPLEFVLYTGLVGVGVGVFQSPNNSAIMGAAPRERLGAASGLLALSRTLGHTTGFPLMGAVFAAFAFAGATLPSETPAAVTALSPTAAVTGIRATFSIAALLMLFNAFLAVSAWKMSRRVTLRAES